MFVKELLDKEPVQEAEVVESSLPTKSPIGFNPQGKYIWQENDVIPMLGKDFRDVFNNLKVMYDIEKGGGSEFDKHISLYTALQAAERTFLIAIERGIIVEEKS